MGNYETLVLSFDPPAFMHASLYLLLSIMLNHKLYNWLILF